jgi:hypothetical protein
MTRLLRRMRHFVREEVQAEGIFGLVLAGGEVDVGADRERARVERAGRPR